MAHILQRILRFRQLAEEQARLELERAMQALRRATAACEDQRMAEHRQRIDLANCWIEGPGLSAPDGAVSPKKSASAESMEKDFDAAVENDWLLQQAALEFHGWNRMHLERFCEQESLRMEPMRERHTESRRELRQTEQILEHHAKSLQTSQERRAQSESDAWYLGRRRASSRDAERKTKIEAAPPGRKEPETAD
jgi:hypothetical protein